MTKERKFGPTFFNSREDDIGLDAILMFPAYPPWPANQLRGSSKHLSTGGLNLYF